MIGSIADPLTISERHCRTCGCTDDRPCSPTCSWTEDPLGLGDLCSRCLAIAVSVTDHDLDYGAFPGEPEPTGTPIPDALLAIVVGLTIGAVGGFALGRLWP